MIVRTWMTPNPQTIDPRETLSAAQDKMTRGRFRHLPVVDERGALIAIVTDRDLRRHDGYYATTRVDAAMTEKPFTIGPDEPIETAAVLTLQRQIGGLPVVSADGRLVGIITQTDLVKGLLRSLTGGPEGSARIDFEFGTPSQRFADVVRVIEEKGGAILGLGTVRAEEGSDRRMFYLRVRTTDVAPFTEAVRAAGCIVHAAHAFAPFV
jgi:acetoin utilization protein AcuB